MTNNVKLFCFFCKYIIRGSFKTIHYGGKLKRFCSNCTSREHKVLAGKYKILNCDVKCTGCSRAVSGKNNICCTNCNHFIHSKCANLTPKDIKLIESQEISWTCKACCTNIFPFYNYIPSATNITDRRSSRVVKSCIICTQPLKPNCTPKLISEDNPIYLCHSCDIEQVQIDDMEYLDCSLCNKLVLYESILCSLCNHWVHAQCLSLNDTDIRHMESQIDWCCPHCLSNIFPFYNINSNYVTKTKTLTLTDNTSTTQTYNTCNQCSVCEKIVTSDKCLNCSQCRHWVHQKCIGTFKTSLNEFESFLHHYSNTDWNCPRCIEDIFPFSNVDSSDMELIALEYKHNLTINSRELKQLCTNLLKVDLFDNKFINPTTNTTNIYDDINIQDISPPTNNCNYAFDLKQLEDKCNSAYISLINFNIRSIRANFNNFTDTILHNNNITPCFITLTETWTDTDTNIEDFIITGYHEPLIQNRKKNKGGGVMTYITNNITTYKTRSDLSFCDESNNCLSIEVVLHKKIFILTTIYRSPSNQNNSFMKKFEGIIDKIRHSGYNSIITGDFNYNLINYQHHNDTETLYNIFTSSGYQPAVTKPTRITTTSSTLIDHIWTNYNIEQQTTETHILVTDVTDHLPALYIDRGSKPQAGFTHIKYNQINDRNIESFIQELADNERNLLDIVGNKSNTAVSNYNNYMTEFTRLYNKHFPIRTKKVHNKTLSKPWITPQIQRMIKKKNRLYDKKLKTGKDTHMAKYRLAKKETEKAIKSSKAEYYKDKLYNRSKTTKQRWDTIRELINRQRTTNKQCPLPTNQLGDHYSSVAHKLYAKMENLETDGILSKHSTFRPEKDNKVMFSMKTIEEEEVHTHILDLDITKSPGTDNISTRIVKESGNIIKSHLTQLFNHHIEEGTYPSELKTARCVPIYKGGNSDPYKPINYRPISILGSINKVFEKCLHSQISKYLEDNELLPNFQYGYRKAHNTQQAIADFCNYIEESKNTKQYTIAVFMDLSKAFDTVNKDILLDKMSKLGFDQNSINLISNYMTDRNFCFNNNTHELYQLEHGVPQGSVLGPLLFLIYIYDMKDLCTEIKKIVYADDTTLIITGRTKEEAVTKCNTVLARFYSYFTYNKLTINESKTKYMIFNNCRHTNSNKTQVSKENIVMNNVILEEVQTIRFLGIIINNRLNWSDHKLHIKTKICKSIGILYNCRKFLKHNDLLSMYRTFVEPFFLYCLPVWGNSITRDAGILCKLQNKTLRILFECKRTEDAWQATGNKILKLEQLYQHETAKLCFKQHINILPLYFNKTIMPTLSDSISHQYNLRNNTDKQYNYIIDNKQQLSFSKNCITTWNSLPKDLKEMPYTRTSYQHFKFMSKRHLIHRQS